MKPSEIYPVSLELQTTLLCMDMMTAIMIRISVLSCNMPVRLAFVLTRIPFIGHVIGADGLQPDPRKIESKLSMDHSTSLASLQTFLGMVQFLSRFIPNLASIAARLWSLTKKTSEFVWSPEHLSAVDRIKKVITSPTLPAVF